MKHRLILFLIITSISFVSTAQILSGDPHVEKFLAESQKDPAYKKFQGEIQKLISSTRGRAINLSAINKLFLANRALLQNIYKRSGLAESSVKRGSADRVYKGPGSIYHALPKKFNARDQMNVTKVPPYDGVYRGSNFPNANMPTPFDTSGSSIATGTIELVSNSCSLHNYCYLGIFSKGFKESFTVPNNPEILAARVKFEYSFFYTAWDTYGAKNGIDLLFRSSSNFTSVTYNQYPDGPYQYINPSDRWKIVGNIFPRDSITTDVGEYHADINSSYTIEGYVVPGSVIDFHFGLNYMPQTNKGLMGNYHYGEFKLKRIIVTYLKSGE